MDRVAALGGQALSNQSNDQSVSERSDASSSSRLRADQQCKQRIEIHGQLQRKFRQLTGVENGVSRNQVNAGPIPDTVPHAWGYWTKAGNSSTINWRTSRKMVTMLTGKGVLKRISGLMEAKGWEANGGSRDPTFSELADELIAAALLEHQMRIIPAIAGKALTVNYDWNVLKLLGAPSC